MYWVGEKCFGYLAGSMDDAASPWALLPSTFHSGGSFH
jgi:hypothetical protein